jgi:menaquinone-dependent protoporphyrinogen oxidase
MDERILVTYATLMGATTGIARAIGIEIRAGGTAVRVLPIEHVGKIDEYRSVIVGSPIYEGNWLEPAVTYLQQHRVALSKIPVAFFAVCAKRNETLTDQECRVQRAMDRVLERFPDIKPVDIGIFTGAFNSKRWTLPTLLSLKAQGELPLDGDFRDWEVIRAWAVKILPLLTPQAAVTHR